MSETTEISCACRQTRLELKGDPILVSECLCDSCRVAADRLATLPVRRMFLHPTARRLARNIARTGSGSCPARSTSESSGCPPSGFAPCLCDLLQYADLPRNEGRALAERLSAPLAGRRTPKGRDANDGWRPA